MPDKVSTYVHGANSCITPYLYLEKFTCWISTSDQGADVCSWQPLPANCIVVIEVGGGGGGGERGAALWLGFRTKLVTWPIQPITCIPLQKPSNPNGPFLGQWPLNLHTILFHWWLLGRCLRSSFIWLTSSRGPGSTLNQRSYPSHSRNKSRLN